MKVFIVEPSRNGKKFEDCHVVAANSVQEILPLLEKKGFQEAVANWRNCNVRVWNLIGAEYDAPEPCVIDYDMHIDASTMLRPKTKGVKPAVE